MTKQTDIIRNLNDKLRKTLSAGIVILTSGIKEKSQEFIDSLMLAISNFDDFNEDNDPWGEHDCAVMEHLGTKIIWKIDYYDETLEFGSSNPADENITTRVLTIMLSREY